MSAHYNVLFLCTGNSARSILAEGILNRKGKGTFTAYSAGSHPSGRVHPEALKQLELAGISTEGARCKSCDEFAVAGCSYDGLCLYGVRQRCERGLSVLAGTAHDSALGCSRPGRCKGHARRD